MEYFHSKTAIGSCKINTDQDVALDSLFVVSRREARKRAREGVVILVTAGVDSGWCRIQDAGGKLMTLLFAQFK